MNGILLSIINITSLQWQANTARHVLSTREYSIAWYQSAEWISWPAYNDRQTLPVMCYQPESILLLGINQLNESHNQPTMTGKHCPSCAINQRVFYCLVSISWMNLMTSLQWQANTARHVLSTREYSIAWYQSAEWISFPAYNDRQTLPVMCYQPESILLLGINQLNESHYQPPMTGKHCPSCAINQRVFYCLVSISWMNLMTSLQWQANTARHVLSTREYFIAWYQSAEWISLPAYNDRQTLPVMCYQPESILLLGINQLNESHDQPTMTGKHCPSCAINQRVFYCLNFLTTICVSSVLSLM